MPDLSPASIAAGGIGDLLRRRLRRSPKSIGFILVHHEVAVAQGDPESEVLPALGTENFVAQLEHLGRHYEVVPLAELQGRAAARGGGERLPVAITFDDDIAGHASVAAPLLERFGFPATFFLCGNTLAGPDSSWWHDLQALLDKDGWQQIAAQLAEQWPWIGIGGPRHQFTLALETARPELRDAIAARLRELADKDPSDPGLAAETVADLARRGFEIGFHTRHHYSLQALDDDELAQAMVEGLDELEAAAGYRPSSIAYPYGNADMRVAGAAQRAGFEVGVLGGHSATGVAQHPLLLGRAVAWTPTLGVFKYVLGRLGRG